jgi:hypothetical protein
MSIGGWRCFFEKGLIQSSTPTGVPLRYTRRCELGVIRSGLLGSVKSAARSFPRRGDVAYSLGLAKSRSHKFRILRGLAI